MTNTKPVQIQFCAGYFFVSKRNLKSGILTLQQTATKKATRNEYGWQIVLVVGGLRERLNDSSVSHKQGQNRNGRNRFHRKDK